MRQLFGVAVLAALASSPAHAEDAGSLQVAVAAPDPAFAGETVSFQVLAVNSGAVPWLEGAYSWEAEVYDLEKTYIAKTERLLPKGDVPGGGVASAVLPFSIPDSLVGRKYFRVFLTHEGKRLIESDYIPFSIVEKPFTPAPPPAQTVEVEKPPEYRIGGNASFLYKYVGGVNQGATTVNAVGKAGYSSFLFNSYFLHNSPPTNNLVDPYIIVLNWYAPWGTVNAGDISPTFSPLSLAGQGMRGLELQQRKEHAGWVSRLDLLGGRIFPASTGSTGTDGRYERWAYGARYGADLPHHVTLGADYVLSQDNATSLSSDPNNPRFRGPTLRPASNPLYGLNAGWEPAKGLNFKADFQESSVSTDTDAGVRAVSDSAWRTEVSLARSLFSARAGVQRTGTRFAAFASPSAIPDRFTTDGGLTLYPVKWNTPFMTLTQFKDNLSHDPAKTTTQQRTWTAGDGMHFKTGTDATVTVTQNTVQGQPSSVLDNKTDSLLGSLSQTLGRQSLSASFQESQFRDNTGTSHGLDTQTVGLRGTGRFGDRFSGSLGATLSGTKDIVDGSNRNTNSISGSLEFPIVRDKITDQVWGTWTTVHSSSGTADGSTSYSLNTEVVWRYKPNLTYSFGVGYNFTSHTVLTTENQKQFLASLRVNYAFEVSSRPAGK